MDDERMESPVMGLPASTHLASDVHAAAQARRWFRAQVRHQVDRSMLDPDLLADAEVVISELVTNSVRAGGNGVTLEVAPSGRGVRVRVTDDAPGTPQVLEAQPDDVHGRGLALVQALSLGWGIAAADPGKQVWADLAIAR
ncbi:MAG: ATP-binding protein [Actinobacteria bacterium]|nr:ATP-binding protein [Actinomycetota bacterium]